MYFSPLQRGQETRRAALSSLSASRLRRPLVSHQTNARYEGEIARDQRKFHGISSTGTPLGVPVWGTQLLQAYDSTPAHLCRAIPSSNEVYLTVSLRILPQFCKRNTYFIKTSILFPSSWLNSNLANTTHAGDGSIAGIPANDRMIFHISREPQTWRYRILAGAFPGSHHGGQQVNIPTQLTPHAFGFRRESFWSPLLWPSKRILKWFIVNCRVSCPAISAIRQARRRCSTRMRNNRDRRKSREDSSPPVSDTSSAKTVPRFGLRSRLPCVVERTASPTRRVHKPHSGIRSHPVRLSGKRAGSVTLCGQPSVG